MALSKRLLVDASVNGSTTSYSNKTNVSSKVTGVQTRMSYGHPRDQLIREGRDAGGDFFVFTPKLDIVRRWGGTSGPVIGDNTYKGELAYLPYNAFSGSDGMSPALRSELITYGTTAIARCIPTNPVSDMVTAIAEIRKEGLPSVPGKQLKRSDFKDFREYGSEYLNIQFGALPLVSDLQDFTKAAMNSEKILKQFERDAGRNIRRRYEFPKQVTKTVTKASGKYPSPSISTWHYKGPYESTITITTTKRRWFSGAFTYAIPQGDTALADMQRHAQRAKKLYGVRLTPDVIWNLSPWSWAADWVTNAGDVITNMSAFASDGLVMRYGYSMQETVTEINCVLLGPGLVGGGARHLETNYVMTTKSRVRATPYGFGLKTDDFSVKQWSILAALGIARAPGRGTL